MVPNSVHGGTSVAPTALELDGRPLGFSVHTLRQSRWRLFALLAVMAVLASLYPVLATSSYSGSADLHATIEIAGAVLGLIAGFALVMRFYAFGNRFHLLIGLAFFVNGAEDLVHGLLSFVGLHGLAGMSSSSLEQFIPGTYVAGRLMLGVLLLSAPFAKSWPKSSEMPQRETVWGSCAALFLTLVVTAIAFRLPLPRFIYPEYFISRPADFVSALVLLAALVVFIREYRRTRDMLTWWVALSIGINLVGQLMMSFSKTLYDPFFDISHVYKVLGYAVPLLGFSSYQVTVAAERRLALHSAFRQAMLLNAINRVLMESMRCETEEDMAKACLTVVEELTGSKFGFIGEINDAGRFDTIALTNPGWHACRMPEEDATRLLKDMELRGIWSTVFRDERSVIVNDPASHPSWVGTPEGHPPLTSFLGVPLKLAGETIGMIGLANKESGYDPADQEVVEALSVAFIEALQRKRAEDALIAHRDHLEELVAARTTDLSKANEELQDEIDEHTRTVDALAKERNLLRTLIDNLPDYICAKDSDGGFILNNAAHVRVLGANTPDEAVGKTDYDFFPRELADQYFSNDQAVIRSGQPMVNREETSIDKEGRKQWLLSTMVPLRDDQGTTIGIISISRDITERKLMGEALERHAELLEQANADLEARNRELDEFT